MREKTDSITHLVKIVAGEVFEEKWEENMKCRKDLKDLETHFCETIQSKVEKAGKPWSDEEDELLLQELRTAVAQIALNHKRSLGAISSRIQQRKLDDTILKR